MTTELTTYANEPITPIHLEGVAAAASFLDLPGATDLLVIGSRRWAPMARLLLGGTGEALVHGAQCSLLIVPRPHTES